MLILGFIGIVVALAVFGSVARSKQLAAMTPEERESFLAEEQKTREAREQAALKKQEIADGKASLPARQAINVAKAEGRSYARAWIPLRDVERLERWAGRNDYTALRVKSGNSGDIQMSFSGWK